jgi:hypothetical protein
MKLKALDQFHISSVSADTLKPGQEFHVSDSFGQELLKKHAGKFECLDVPEAEEATVTEDEKQKSEPAPQNKAEDAPANKADNGKKGKGDK